MTETKQHWKKQNRIPNTTLQVQFFHGRCSSVKQTQASLTVEAALVMPFFLLILAGFLYWIPFMQFHMRVQMSLEEITQKMAVYAYAGGILPEEDMTDAGLLAQIVAAGSMQGIIREVLETEYADRMQAAGVSGGFDTFWSSVQKEQGLLDAVVVYQERLRGIPEPVGRFRVVQRSTRRLWTGKSLVSEEENSKEQLVYVTQNGTVYHTNPNCTYLKTVLLYRPMEQIETSRNKNGEIYRACERCKASAADCGAYITKYGNRYHNTASCPALSRTIRKLPLSQTEGLPQCSKCRAEEENE